jgi:hypothetical protein
MKHAVIAALLIAPLAQAAPPISLSFHELVEHPAKYNGKRVSVRAYLVTSCEHCGEFFADVHCARHHRAKHGVAIGRLVKASLMDSWPRNRIASVQYKTPNDGLCRLAAHSAGMTLLVRFLLVMIPRSSGFASEGLVG